NRKRGNRGQREHQIASQRANGVPHILNQLLEPNMTPNPARILHRLSPVAESLSRCSSRFARGHSGFNLFLNFRFEVTLEFPLHLVFELAPPKEPKKPLKHQSSCGRIARDIARTSCFHLDSSTVSCFRPAVVNR